MTALTPPRHPVVDRALDIARAWCAGQIIDDAPALRHAVLVARTLVRYVPEATPDMVAATLLHDAPEFAPANLNLDLVLDQVGRGVAPIVRAVAREHEEMMAGGSPVLDNLPTTLVSAADKIVAFRSLVTRAHRAPDPAQFWNQRTALRRLVPYFNDWCRLAVPTLPPAMASDLTERLTNLTDAIATINR